MRDTKDNTYMEYEGTFIGSNNNEVILTNATEYLVDIKDVPFFSFHSSNIL